MTDSERMDREEATSAWSERKRDILWFVIAMLPAVVYFFSISSEPFHDAVLYWDLGRAFAETGIYGTADAPEGYTPPGYAIFVAVIVKVFGESARIVAVFNLFLYAGTLLLTRYIGACLYSRKTGVAAMVITGWVYDLFSIPPILLSENLFITMFLGGIAIMVGGKRETVWARFAIAGLLLGVTALVRGTIVLLIPFLAIGLVAWVWWSWRRRMTIALPFALLFACFLLPVSAWTYRN